jgi:hypothetical protein
MKRCADLQLENDLAQPEDFLNWVVEVEGRKSNCYLCNTARSLCCLPVLLAEIPRCVIAGTLQRVLAIKSQATHATTWRSSVTDASSQRAVYQKMTCDFTLHCLVLCGCLQFVGGADGA